MCTFSSQSALASIWSNLLPISVMCACRHVRVREREEETDGNVSLVL